MQHRIKAKTILNKTKRRDPLFLDDYTLNPYSGCSFNCLYCFIRGSKYGVHMERKLGVKENAVELLEKALKTRAAKGQFGIIVMSSSTDPYLQQEEKTQLSRQLLEVILHYRFPVHIITKSDLVCRDFDLLRRIDEVAQLPSDLLGKLPGACLITFSFSSLQEHDRAIFEPGAPSVSNRLHALQLTLKEGFHAGVSLMPLLPFISDTAENLDQMFTKFREMGARYVIPATLSLWGEDPASGKQLMLRAIAKHYPHLTEKYRRWFKAGDEMPGVYKEAFARKMTEMSRKYYLPDRPVLPSDSAI